MRRLFIGVLIIGSLIGCATVWPDACRVQDGVRICTCAVLKFTISKHPDKPSPAGVVGLTCDKDKLPLEAYGQAVVK